MSQSQITESIYKLISTVHIAIRYRRYYPINELYIKLGDKHIYKCYARLYYMVSGQYLYCNKLTLLVSSSQYRENPKHIKVCWPRYWLIEMGSFNVAATRSQAINRIRLVNNSLEVYTSDLLNNPVLYYTMLTCYGIKRAEFSGISADTIILEKSALPITVNPVDYSEYDLSWYSPRKSIVIYPEPMRVAVAGCRAITAPITSVDADEPYIRKHAVFAQIE